MGQAKLRGTLQERVTQSQERKHLEAIAREVAKGEAQRLLRVAKVKTEAERIPLDSATASEKNVRRLLDQHGVDLFLAIAAATSIGVRR